MWEEESQPLEEFWSQSQLADAFGCDGDGGTPPVGSAIPDEVAHVPVTRAPMLPKPSLETHKANLAAYYQERAQGNSDNNQMIIDNLVREHALRAGTRTPSILDDEAIIVAEFPMAKAVVPMADADVPELCVQVRIEEHEGETGPVLKAEQSAASVADITQQAMRNFRAVVIAGTREVRQAATDKPAPPQANAPLPQWQANVEQVLATGFASKHRTFKRNCLKRGASSAELECEP